MSILFIEISLIDLTAGISRPSTETVISGRISAQSETVTSECFATLKCESNSGTVFAVPFYIWGIKTLAIKLYEVSHKYINYLEPYAPHLFRNKKPGQQNERKYIGIVLVVNGMKYFAPLSSYKLKHDNMKNSMDFIKIGNYAVVNINNMFPVPESEYTYVEIEKIKNEQYKKLLMAEYRILKKLQEKIRKNAAELYKHKIEKGNRTTLAKRCNDFLLLEKMCKTYKK